MDRGQFAGAARSLIAALAAAVVALGPASAATAGTGQQSDHGQDFRVSAWSPSMTTGGPSFDDQTIRMVAHSSIGGSGARITLSNRYSQTALAIGAVDIAVQSSGGTAVPSTSRTVTFGQARRVGKRAGGGDWATITRAAIHGGTVLISAEDTGTPTTGMAKARGPILWPRLFLARQCAAAGAGSCAKPESLTPNQGTPTVSRIRDRFIDQFQTLDQHR